MVALPNRARVHKDQPPKGAAAPNLPSPDARVAVATSTSPGRNLGHSHTCVDHNISAW